MLPPLFSSNECQDADFCFKRTKKTGGGGKENKKKAEKEQKNKRTRVCDKVLSKRLQQVLQETLM